MKISQLEIPNLILYSRLESGQVAQAGCFYPFETGVYYLPIHYFNGNIVLLKWNPNKENAE